ncbi:MAG: magnesium transporter [Candidatus Nitronauta litoralis]|uniref:Magnesium transporter MgtE n=1 Tax=Candidatus Nitronauta litoralis TaxID=2705533 RepID=A0A7T0BYL5_9BACT|nr:MAG: magnesium transporter [Candidatus Nitronauta litoralis]
MPVNKLKSILESADSPETSKLVNEMDQFEIARVLHAFPTDQKTAIFQLLDTEEKQQDVLYETDIESRKEITKALGLKELVPLIEAMPADEAADIIQEHPPAGQAEILDKLPQEDARIIKDLIHYKEETAGGMMNPDFNRVSGDQLAGDLLMSLIREPGLDRGHYFFVVDDTGKLKGFFKMRDLLHAPANFRADQIIRDYLPTVDLTDPFEKVANLMDHEHMSTLPVLDSNNVIHGIVTFDDVLRVMQDEASEDIFTMVGTAKVDPFAKSTISKVRARAPWLLTTFVGGIVSAFVLKSFQLRVPEFATILFFVPFVLGLAGNVGIQGATVIVRGLATGDIKDDNLKTVVVSEVMVGVINGALFGIICGILIALAAQPLLGAPTLLGASVGIGIVLAVCAAGFIGSLAPLAFIKLEIDPAISTGPVVTVINDILGLTIYMLASGVIFSMLG